MRDKIDSVKWAENYISVTRINDSTASNIALLLFYIDVSNINTKKDIFNAIENVSVA